MADRPHWEPNDAQWAVMEERSELWRRLQGLRDETGDREFAGLHHVERELMLRQLAAMTEYLSFLDRRIAYWREPTQRGRLAD